MTSTIGVKKIQHTNGTQVMTFDTTGKISSNVSSTGNITTTGTVNTPSINSGQIGGRRNIIINGAMQIFQRGTSLNQSAGTNTYTHSADRFRYEEGIEQWAGTMSQSTDTPANEQFQYSLKTLTTATETAIDADDFLQHTYYVEVNDGARIGFGKSSCKVSTLSFYVKSSVAGLYGIGISNHDGSQTLPLNYTINSADTWEKKTLTVPARTSGTWETTGNAKLMGIRFCMGRTGSSYSNGTAGSWSDDSGWAKLNSNNQSSIADWSRTASSEFYLTGVQYEVGEQATPFEHKSFGEELALCQRYFFQINGTGTEYATMSSGQMYQTTTYLGYFQTPVPMRTRPSFSLNNSLSNSNFSVVTGGAVRPISGVTPTGDNQYLRINASTTTSGTQGHGAYIQLQGGYNALWDAEL
tara:strand:- start:530 stop:1762 length:1233 start_codon:yes stop_codon:yes gene_type:complete